MKENRILEKRFCRLCGKTREEKDFAEVILPTVGRIIVRYRACKSCNVVIHNISTLTGGAAVLERAMKQSPPNGEPRIPK